MPATGADRKTATGCDGRTVEGLYVACVHKRGLVPIMPRNAGDGRTASTRKMGSGWTGAC
ncbi:MAG: hypothetical protein ABIT81_08610 [Ferruginibacter sp.]